MQNFLRKVYILVWKDFLIDLRRKDKIPSMLLFLTINFLIFQFSIGEDINTFKNFLPGIIWVIFIFTGVLGLEKSFVQESESGCIGGLLIVPLERSILFLGKMIANTFFLLIIQFIFIPSVIILFDIDLKSWLALFNVLFLGTIGFSALGTLLTALTATVKGKEMLLPVLMFPLIIPSVLCVVKITESLFFATNQAEVMHWWRLLFGFDVILLIVSILGFEFVIEE